MHTTSFRLVFNDEVPRIFSEPPYIDEDGDYREAEIVVVPVNDNSAVVGIDRVKMGFSIDEADRFARHLWKIVEDARKGKFAPQSGSVDLPPPPAI